MRLSGLRPSTRKTVGEWRVTSTKFVRWAANSAVTLLLLTTDFGCAHPKKKTAEARETPAVYQLGEGGIVVRCGYYKENACGATLKRCDNGHVYKCKKDVTMKESF
jgi:hypothetical protein